MTSGLCHKLLLIERLLILVSTQPAPPLFDWLFLLFYRSHCDTWSCGKKKNKTGANNTINSFHNAGSQSPCHHAMMLLVAALPGVPLPHVLTFTEYDSTSNNPHFPDHVNDETKHKNLSNQYLGHFLKSHPSSHSHMAKPPGLGSVKQSLHLCIQSRDFCHSLAVMAD